MPLLDWQEPIAAKLIPSLKKHSFVVNACTTGAGKTYICCEIIRRLKTPALIVAPKSSLTQWRRVAEEYGILDYILDIINPEQISKPTGCVWYTRDDLWCIPENTMVVWDEIHRGASGRDSITTKAVAQLKAYPGAMLHAMSATVACNPLQLRAVGYWAGLHKFKKGSFENWCKARGCTFMETKGRWVFRFTRNENESKRIMAQIRQELGNMFLGLGPDEIPGFPEQTLQTKLIDLSKKDRKEIEKAYEAMSERMRSNPGSDLAMMGRERERIEFIMAEPLVQLVLNSVEDGNSAVIFFNFTEPRERFTKLLRKKYSGGISEIYGQQKTDRQEQIDLFQNNTNPIIVVNTEAGGVALSLHDVLKQRPRESFIIPSYNAAAIKQALGRIRRAEGTHATQNFVFAANTVQERVMKSMQKKMGDIEALNDADLVP